MKEKIQKIPNWVNRYYDTIDKKLLRIISEDFKKLSGTEKDKLRGETINFLIENTVEFQETLLPSEEKFEDKLLKWLNNER